MTPSLSGASGGGVSQILAGTGVSVSPSGGEGVVTVSAPGSGVSVVGPFPFDHSVFKTDGDAVVLWTPPAGTIVLDIFFRSDTFVPWSAGDVTDFSTDFAIGPGSPNFSTQTGWWASPMGETNDQNVLIAPPSWAAQGIRASSTDVTPPQVSDGTTIKVVNSNGDGSATVGYADVLFVVQFAAPVVP